MMRDTLIIFRKELKEILRDRRTLAFMLVMPMFLMPLLVDVSVSFIIKSQRKAASEVLQYAIVEEGNLPALAERFADSEGFEKIALAETTDEAIIAAIRSQKIDFALRFSAASASASADPAGSQSTVHVYYDNAASTSKARNRAGAIIDAVSDAIRSERLQRLGVAPDAEDHLLHPIAQIDVPVADERALMGEVVGGILPYIFIIFCFLGSLYPAIDLGAGEKERGTLETLLLVPVVRRNIVIGKYLVVFTAGATSAILSLTSLGVWLATRGKQIVGDLGGTIEIGRIIQSIGPVDLALIAVMLVPTAAMFAAVLLSLSIYAKSFKEAQSYAAPLNILIVLPAFVSMLPGVELDWKWAMVPISNISLAVKELIKGTMNYQMLVAILGSSMAIAAALLGFCTWWFRRESVLFRQ